MQLSKHATAELEQLLPSEATLVACIVSSLARAGPQSAAVLALQEQLQPLWQRLVAQADGDALSAALADAHLAGRGESIVELVVQHMKAGDGSALSQLSVVLGLGPDALAHAADAADFQAARSSALSVASLARASLQTEQHIAALLVQAATDLAAQGRFEELQQLVRLEAVARLRHTLFLLCWPAAAASLDSGKAFYAALASDDRVTDSTMDFATKLLVYFLKCAEWASRQPARANSAEGWCHFALTGVDSRACSRARAADDPA